MKINRLYLLTGSIIILLALLEFIELANNTQSDPEGMQEQRSALLLQQWNQHYSSNEAYDTLWGIKKSKKLTAEPKSTHQKEKHLKMRLDPVGKKFCIEKECYRLIGLYSSADAPSVSFYNKSTKIKDYHLNETLGHTIVIDAISSSSVTLVDSNTSRSWTLRLFDVNQTKYKPKDYNETY